MIGVCRRLKYELRESNLAMVEAFQKLGILKDGNLSYDNINFENANLIADLQNSLIIYAIGPYIVFLARLLEELKSSTPLSALITPAAYTYLDEFGRVFLVRTKGDYSIHGGWMLQVHEWVFRPNTNAETEEANPQPNAVEEAANPEELTLEEAATRQLVALGEALGENLPQYGRLSSEKGKLFLCASVCVITKLIKFFFSC